MPHRLPLAALAALAPLWFGLVGCGDDELPTGADTHDVVNVDTATPADTSTVDTASADDTAEQEDVAPDALDEDTFPAVHLPDAGVQDGSGDDDADASPPNLAPLGGERPAPVYLPETYDPAVPTPLVILLHGYTATGPVQDLYLGFHQRATAAGMIAVVPTGTVDGFGSHFWNADPAWCCNFGDSGVDDESYLLGLVSEARSRFNVDAGRVYFLGHSNGGFMSYRMACAHADVVAGIVSIAGSLPKDIGDCAPSRPVTVVEAHGTLDAVISYYGTSGYPGAEATIDRWVGYDGCDPVPVESGGFDYDSAALGDETDKLVWGDCEGGVLVGRWTMKGSSHVPLFTEAFLRDAFAFLLSHRRD